MNLPTKITFARILLIPVMLICFCLRDIFDYYYILVATIFFISAVTDFIDGYIARKYDMVTNLGKFLDPIADKILVVAGLVILIADSKYLQVNIYFLVVATTVIMAREFIIGVFRQMAASKGCVMQADKLGKIKTISTLCGITWLLISPLKYIDTAAAFYIGNIFYYAGYASFAFCVIMTIVSGVNYIVKNINVLKEDAITDVNADNCSSAENAKEDKGKLIDVRAEADKELAENDERDENE